VEGKPLAKGVYGLHNDPEPGFVHGGFFRKTKHRVGGSYSYDQKEDALARGCETQATRRDQGALEFDFEDLKADFDGGDAKVGKLGIPFTVSVNDAEQTLQNIRAQTKGAGQFCLASLGSGGAVSV